MGLHSTQMDEKQFETLFHEYKNRLYGYILTIAKDPVAAEEITQDIFVKLWISRDLLSQVTNMEGYLFAIARNRTINYLRKAANDAHFLQELQGYMDISPGLNNIDEKLMTGEYEKLVAHAVDELSPQRRKVYELSRHQGLTMDQIAAHLGLSRNTVKNHLVDALASIRSYLAHHSDGMLLLLLFMTR